MLLKLITSFNLVSYYLVIYSNNMLQKYLRYIIDINLYIIVVRIFLNIRFLTMKQYMFLHSNNIKASFHYMSCA